MGAELLLADGQTGRHDEANSRSFVILRTRLSMRAAFFRANPNSTTC